MTVVNTQLILFFLLNIISLKRDIVIHLESYGRVVYIYIGILFWSKIFTFLAFFHFVFAILPEACRIG